MSDKTPTPEATGDNATPKTDSEEKGLGGQMTFIEHLEELRRRIVVSLLTIGVCFVVVYGLLSEDMVEFILKPMRESVEGLGKFQYTVPYEKFMFELKLSAVVAIFISLPMIFYQFWAFVAPGLYQKERRLVGPLILFSTLFFAGGAAFFYLIVFPVISDFFAKFAEVDWIEFNPKFSDTFTFVVALMFAFGLVFEMPLVVFVLAKLNLVSAGFLNKNRKYALVVIVLLAAFFTPPDVVSQAMLAGPMWILYELSVLIAWLFGPRRKKEPEEAG